MAKPTSAWHCSVASAWTRDLSGTSNTRPSRVSHISPCAEITGSIRRQRAALNCPSSTFQTAFLDDCAFREQLVALCQTVNETEILLNRENVDALTGQSQAEARQFVDDHWRKSLARLVEHEQIGIRHQSATDRQHLMLSPHADQGEERHRPQHCHRHRRSPLLSLLARSQTRAGVILRCNSRRITRCWMSFVPS